MWILGIIALVALAIGLLYAGRTQLAWSVPSGLGLLWWALAGGVGGGVFSAAVAIFGVLVVFLSFTPLRKSVVTPFVMRAIAPFLPRMSETERVALEAGTIWWDADLFSGNPDWKKWLRNDPPKLSDRERAFLDGPVEELCRIVDEYEAQQTGDIPEEAWQLLREKKFFGMIVPETYGGLGFSAQANSAVVAKCSSRSTGLAVTVMVPNSLGPAELLIHYGTDEQKQYYLPRLATAEEVPCFALTEPTAGSDAGGMRSYGVVCRGEFEGKEVIGMRLTWNKRYITLGPVATVLGLAFRLYDPEHLLGDTEDLGITCALIPAEIPGVDLGRRHDPLGAPFMNGPTTGNDVFVPVDMIIGGPAMAGEGWRMLMQCLSAGRGISLPSLAAGASQLATRTLGAYATVREQFNLPLGKFEGVQEAMARVAGNTYALDALRLVTAASVDAGEKPSVISAVAKCYSTETMRSVLNDTMDVLGGAGVSLGPRNIMASPYVQAPIGITVEGANILTRTMIVFGQGALRCHPYARHEVEAVARKDAGAFDELFFKHIGFVCQNMARSFLLGLTGARFLTPPGKGRLARYYPQLTRMSAAFATCADFAMGTLGGNLKRKEQLTGKLADAFAWLYIGSTVLKKFHDEGQNEQHVPYARWALDQSLYNSQQALGKFIDNLPNRLAAKKLRVVCFPWGMRHTAPSDTLNVTIAEGILESRDARKWLTHAIFVPPRAEPGLGQLEDALEKVVAARPVHKVVKAAIRAKKLPARPSETLYDRALKAGVINEQEHTAAMDAEAARLEAITVDSFSTLGGTSGPRVLQNDPPEQAETSAAR